MENYLQELTPVGIWLWENFGKEIINKALDKSNDKLASTLEKFKWREAANRYRCRLQDLYSTVRMLGNPNPVPLEGIYTDLYILDRPTAFYRYDIERLRQEHTETGSLSSKKERRNALDLVNEKDRLFILGKPGAGKTTLLKYITLLGAQEKIQSVPIFISLNDFAQSKLDLREYIEQQFEICSFPDAANFIEDGLLKKGRAIILFDGLDEVNEESGERQKITRTLSIFTSQYPANKYVVTCRVAAMDYSFEKFPYVEIADFTSQQIESFAKKWFVSNPSKGPLFIKELSKEQNSGLRELAQTPILLNLLCLNFEETFSFPPRRVEIYEEAIDALLKKWDVSRNIKRDDIYKGLSVGRKRQLFSKIAADYFDAGEIFFKEKDVAKKITEFLETLPIMEGSDPPDGETVLKAIEAQHGLLVERAYGIHSFSHLTLQEYFVAKYIVDHISDGALKKLIQNNLIDNRWREVFLLTSSLLAEASAFLAQFQKAANGLIEGDEEVNAVVNWAKENRSDGHLTIPATFRIPKRKRITNLAQLLVQLRNSELTEIFQKATSNNQKYNQKFLLSDINHLSDHECAFVAFQSVSFAHRLIRQAPRHRKLIQKVLTNVAKISKRLALESIERPLSRIALPEKGFTLAEMNTLVAELAGVLARYRDLGVYSALNSRQIGLLEKYLQANILLADCADIAALSKRNAIMRDLLLPPRR